LGEEESPGNNKEDNIDPKAPGTPIGQTKRAREHKNESGAQKTTKTT